MRYRMLVDFSWPMLYSQEFNLSQLLIHISGLKIWRQANISRAFRAIHLSHWKQTLQSSNVIYDYWYLFFWWYDHYVFPTHACSVYLIAVIFVRKSFETAQYIVPQKKMTYKVLANKYSIDVFEPPATRGNSSCWQFDHYILWSEQTIQNWSINLLWLDYNTLKFLM